MTAFEPDSAECERLNRDAASLPYPIRYLPVALGRESDDAVPFHVTNWPVASSVRRPNTEFLHSFPDAEKLFAVREEVQTTRPGEPRCTSPAARACSSTASRSMSRVPPSTCSWVRRAFRHSRLEVEAELNPLFTDEALFPEVDSHLRERGWVLQGLRRTSWRRGARLEPSASGLGGQIVSVDALFRTTRYCGAPCPRRLSWRSSRRTCRRRRLRTARRMPTN